MGVSDSLCVTVKRLAFELEGDFRRIHSDATGNGLCHCVAWWVPNWDGWGGRTREQNAALREKLFSDGVHDGYLIYSSGELAGWCQAWRRDAFTKLAEQFGAASDDDAWMIGCILILPEFRARGIARGALSLIIDDLKLRGARTIDAYPKRGAAEPEELWNGAESTYVGLGFSVVREDAKRPVLRLKL